MTGFEAPRGTHDILPAEQPLWRLVVREAERLCSLYGYRPIQTPGFEDTALFQRTSGESSDVVQKEMYTFEDRGGRSLTLRPEGTAPIARAYLEHGLHRAQTADRALARRAYLDTIYAAIPTEPFTREMAQIAAKIDAEARRIGSTIPFADLMIGSTALHFGYGVGTRNLRHFQMIPNLPVIQL